MHTYTFNDLADEFFCLPNGDLDGAYQDLVFVGGANVGSCNDGAFFGGPFGGGIPPQISLLPFSPGFSILLTDEASEVSIETFPVSFLGPTSTPTLLAYDADGFDADCVPSSVDTGDFVRESLVCSEPIKEIRLEMLFFLLDNLSVTYIYEGGIYEGGSGDVTATAGLSPVDGKSLKHNKGVFTVEATCSDGTTVPTATLNEVTVEDGGEVALRLKSGKSGKSAKSAKSKKSGKSGKPLKIQGDPLILTVTCDGDTDTAEPEFPDKSEKSHKSGKSKG